MTDSAQTQEPLDLLKAMWANMGIPLPGMVTPTLDTNELDKRIADLKSVEGWLRSNLSMLQLTIQGLEMQRSALAAMQAVRQTTTGAEPNPFANPALWPWNMMQTTNASKDQTANTPEADTKNPT